MPVASCGAPTSIVSWAIRSTCPSSGERAWFVTKGDANEDPDPCTVTADMVTTILADEEGHMRMFEGFLREYEKK